VCCQPRHLRQQPLVGLRHSRLGGTLLAHLALQACVDSMGGGGIQGTRGLGRCRAPDVRCWDWMAGSAKGCCTMGIVSDEIAYIRVYGKVAAEGLHHLPINPVST
jgi:hypothetical protein